MYSSVLLSHITPNPSSIANTLRVPNTGGVARHLWGLPSTTIRLEGCMIQLKGRIKTSQYIQCTYGLWILVQPLCDVPDM